MPPVEEAPKPVYDFKERIKERQKIFGKVAITPMAEIETEENRIHLKGCSLMRSYQMGLIPLLKWLNIMFY